MTIILKVVSVLLITLYASEARSQEQIKKDSSYLNKHYQNRLDFFNAMPNQKNEIVFLGDNQIESGKWQELIDKKHVINRGIRDDVTHGIYARLSEIIESKPKKVFLICGIDDMKRGVSNKIIANNIQKIISKIKLESPKTKVYIQSLLPVNEGMLFKANAQISNQKVNDLNNLLVEVSKNLGVGYINLHPFLADENGELKKEFSLDGLHLRQVTYILWADYLKKLKVL